MPKITFIEADGTRHETEAEVGATVMETAIMNGTTLGKFSMTGLGAVVTKDVSDNELVIGVPAKHLRNHYPDDHPMLSLNGGNGHE